ncbi:MAG: hypothetical protein WCJ03_12405 [Bacteroidales bacterium]
MKTKGMLALAIAAIFTMTVAAQELNSKEKGDKCPRNEFRKEMKEKLSPKKRAGHIAVDLELTDSQRDKLQALYEKQDKQREQQMAEMKQMHEKAMAKMEESRKANDAELEKILGTEKFQQLKAKRSAQMEKAKEMRGKRFHDGEGRKFKGEHRGKPGEEFHSPQQPIQPKI